MTAEFSLSVLDGPTGQVAVIQPNGRLNMVAAPHFTACVSEVIGNTSARIVVDLSQTEFIDSSGLGALVASLKKARQAGGDLRLASPGTQVQTVLELTKLNRVLVPAASVEAAIEAF